MPRRPLRAGAGGVVCARRGQHRARRGAVGRDGRCPGLEAIREKGRQWAANIVELHGGSVSDPVVAGDWFSVSMGIDATYRDMGRVPMEEICVYQVRDGRIVREQFFYNVD